MLRLTLNFATPSEVRSIAMRVSTKASSSQSSMSVRNWFTFGPSLCKDSQAYSPSPISVSSSLSSSYASPLRSSGHSSFQKDESFSQSPVTPHEPQVENSAPKLGRSRRRSGLSNSARVNSRRLQEPEERQSPKMLSRENTTGRQYALALAELANSAGYLDEVNKDAEKLTQLLENEELNDFLISLAIADSKKKSILRTIAEDVEFHECTSTFLDVLVEKKRIHLIKDIAKEFEKIYNDLNDIQVATVTSAVKLEASQLKLVARKIKSLSGATKVRAKNVVDPSLIAGFVIAYDKDDRSKELDMSVKGQMGRLTAMSLSGDYYAERGLAVEISVEA